MNNGLETSAQLLIIRTATILPHRGPFIFSEPDPLILHPTARRAHLSATDNRQLATGNIIITPIS
jgi:hypothetical protein